jgi:hypothetical protein
MNRYVIDGMVKGGGCATLRAGFPEGSRWTSECAFHMNWPGNVRPWILDAVFPGRLWQATAAC